MFFSILIVVLSTITEKIDKGTYQINYLSFSLVPYNYPSNHYPDALDRVPKYVKISSLHVDVLLLLFMTSFCFWCILYKILKQRFNKISGFMKVIGHMAFGLSPWWWCVTMFIPWLCMTLLECQNRTGVFPIFKKARTVGSIMSDQSSSRGSKEAARLVLGMSNLMVKHFYHSHRQLRIREEKETMMIQRL